MKQSEFIQLISNPSKGESADLSKVERLKNEFPYFQSAHILFTLLSKKHDSTLYQQTLRNTAISIPNRSRLYHLLTELAQKNEVFIANDTVPNVVEKKDEVVVPVEDVKAKETSEIEHLKTIELVTEKAEKEPEPVKDKEEELNKQIEKEIEKQIVNSFIEKEVLKTPDLHKKTEEDKKLEAGSFSDWLQALKNMDREGEPKVKEKPVPAKKIVKEPVKDEDKKEEQKSIIDKIIELNPGNIRFNTNQKFYAADSKAKESLFENEDLVTETLAKIYALQGNISKAIRAYEILSLKFPQKSAYFASLIENIKKGNQ